MEYNAKQLINADIEREMKNSFLDYSMSVITSRALPDVCDGLKPVHRRILYTMYERNLTPDRPYKKSADTVGSVLGSYHPHGDASVYDAMVRLAQDFSMRYPLVDGHGNFGSVDGDPPAAYRYTEARLDKLALSMFSDIEKDTVEFVPNYDESKKEPRQLPSRFPQLLVNGSVGIAVGMATNIPPHNMGETIDAVCCLIDNPDATLDDLMKNIQGPDFPTGGIIMGRSGIRAAYGTGRGKITLRARVHFEEGKNDRTRIIVTEIPYMVNKARLIENIADLVRDKRIEGIADLNDESDKEGMRIVIDLKREANPQIVLNQLYSYTQMQDTVGVIMLALVDGQPRLLTLKDMLHEYIKFQEQVIVRRTQYDLNKAKERQIIIVGLLKALDFIDEVIAILRSSKNIPEGKQRLMERFEFSEVQASAIVAMTLGRLTGLERQKLLDENAELIAKIKECEEILADEGKVLSIIKTELGEIKKQYGDERRTSIEAVSGEVDIEDLIPRKECVVTMTRFGYIKRQAADYYKSQGRGGRGRSSLSRRDEDYVRDVFVCSTHDYISFFTSKGRIFSLKCYEIPECQSAARGNNIVNFLQIDPDEKITSMLMTSSFNDDHAFCMVTKRGIVKRVKLSAFRNIRKSGLIAISLDEGDELGWVCITEGDDELIVATRNGYAIRFGENDIREVGRSARGVKAITLHDGDEVVGVAVAGEDVSVVTICDNGYGRRTESSQYRLQSRGGQGTLNYKVGGKYGYVAGICGVHDGDDLFVITDEGVLIRFSVDTIRPMSRYAAGVKVITVGAGSRVVSVASSKHEDENDAESVPTNETAGEGDIADEIFDIPENNAKPADGEPFGEFGDESIFDMPEDIMHPKDEDDGE